MQAQTPSPQPQDDNIYNPYLECCAESEEVGDLKPIARPLTLAHYYSQDLRPDSNTNNMKLLENARNTLHFYTVSLVSDENVYHVGLNRMKLVYLFGKFCEPMWFKKEAKAFKVLDAAPQRSPHIIKLFEAVEANSPGEGFIITYRHKAYSAEKLIPHVKEVMRQLLQAISCCHANGIIHGDIKPENIVWEWNEEQQKPHIYLTDFGVAERVKDLNLLDNANCTAMYSAPERMRMRVSEEPTKMDLWSAGVTFAEMLLGYDSGDKTLFEWGDLEELEVFQARRHELFKAIDPVARDLLDKLLSLDVKLRPSADEALRHPYFTDEPSPDMPHNEELNLPGEEALRTATVRKRKRSTNEQDKESKRRRNS